MPGEQNPSEAFRGLYINDWRQFDEVRLEFHPRLTILTGANASGKSTILGLLGRHFQWTRQFSSAPYGAGRTTRWSRLGRRRHRQKDLDPGQVPIGRIEYNDGAVTQLLVPQGGEEVAGRYDVQMSGLRSFPGVYLTSHRSVAGNYVAVATIPTLFGGADQLFDQFTNEVRTRWLGSWTGKTPQQALKEALMASAVFGEGSESVDSNADARDVWMGFQEVLRRVMPSSLGFKRLRVRVPEVIIESDTGDFILDEASGGLSAILELAWQIFLRSRKRPNFVVLIDEPENHLHPSLQREVVPSLLKAFPQVQFIVATHSPLVVTATLESAVYVLDYNDDNRVTSRSLDYVNRAASADDTLRRVLGLESTMPAWASQRFDDLMSEFAVGTLTAERLASLRQALSTAGLVGHFPKAMVELAQRATWTDTET